MNLGLVCIVAVYVDDEVLETARESVEHGYR
jgi:hypothetical protein